MRIVLNNFMWEIFKILYRGYSSTVVTSGSGTPPHFVRGAPFSSPYVVARLP